MIQITGHLSRWSVFLWVGRKLQLTIVEGNLLDQQVDVIVNSWNRNILPWWLLLPQGVSGAIKRQGGYAPFRELARMPMIPLGGAVITSAGRLPYKAIIHVAGINLAWRGTRRSIRESVVNALALAKTHGYSSIALPIIGAGSGSFKPAAAEAIILETLNQQQFDGRVVVVRYKKP